MQSAVGMVFRGMSRSTDLNHMERSALMVSPVEINAEHLRIYLRPPSLIRLQSALAFRYHLHVEAGNG